MKYGKNLSLKNRVNIEGNTPFIRNLLFDQLRILAGISEKEYALIIKTPISPIPLVHVVRKLQSRKPVIKTVEKKDDVSKAVVKPLPPKK